MAINYDIVSDLTVDESTNSLFWINKGRQIVQFINLKDHKVQSLVLRDSEPTAIAIHGPYLYFADSNHIGIADKVNGSNNMIFRSNTCKNFIEFWLEFFRLPKFIIGIHYCFSLKLL